MGIRSNKEFISLLFLISVCFSTTSCSKQEEGSAINEDCASKYTSNNNLLFRDDFTTPNSEWEFTVDTFSYYDPKLDPKGDSSISYISSENGKLILSCNHLFQSVALWAYYPLEIQSERCFIVLDFDICRLETDHYGYDDGLDIWFVRNGKRIWLNAYNYGTSAYFNLDYQRIYLSVDFSSYLHSACIDNSLDCFHTDSEIQDCSAESIFRMGTSERINGIWIGVRSKYSAESAFSEHQKMVINAIEVYED